MTAMITSITTRPEPPLQRRASRVPWSTADLTLLEQIYADDTIVYPHKRACELMPNYPPATIQVYASNLGFCGDRRARKAEREAKARAARDERRARRAAERAATAERRREAAKAARERARADARADARAAREHAQLVRRATAAARRADAAIAKAEALATAAGIESPFQRPVPTISTVIASAPRALRHAPCDLGDREHIRRLLYT